MLFFKVWLFLAIQTYYDDGLNSILYQLEGIDRLEGFWLLYERENDMCKKIFCCNLT